MAMDSRDIHILAVDDSHLDRKVVERLLVNSSYKVTTVDSALRALEVLGVVGTAAPVVINAVKINLIITDYCMPEMTGYDLLKKVKESSALKEIPVVIMSSENVAERITMCLAEGAKEFILKPLRAADVKRLRTHVKHEDGDLLIEALKRKPVVAPDIGTRQLKRPRRTTNLTDADSNNGGSTISLTTKLEPVKICSNDQADLRKEGACSPADLRQEGALSAAASKSCSTEVLETNQRGEEEVALSSTELIREVSVSCHKNELISREEDQTEATSAREKNEINTACSS